MSQKSPPMNTPPSEPLGNFGSDKEVGTKQDDFPFLVTHWLAHYGREYRDDGGDPQRKEAMERLRKATSDIASAFSALGAYGTTLRPSFGSSFLHQPVPQNSTYSDLSRRWSGLTASHLEHLAQAAVTSNREADNTATHSSHTNLLQAAGESSSDHKKGRTCQDAIDVEDETNGADNETQGFSILHSPVLLSSKQQKSKIANELQHDAERSSSPDLAIRVQSSSWEIGKKTADAMRGYLIVREKLKSTESEIQALEASVAKNEKVMDGMSARFLEIGRDTTLGGTEKLQIFDEIKASKQNYERVITQLKRKLADLSRSYDANKIESVRLEREVSSLYRQRKSIVRGFRDPFESWRGPLHTGHRMGGNRMVCAIQGRQYGMSRSLSKSLYPRSTMKYGPSPSLSSSNRKVVLGTRLSHAGTVNTHLSYPVYCLRFDRTGRYFITGADDYLIKVFHLGAGQSCRTKNDLDGSRLLRCNYGANLRGAVLVASLRGHAGVINDIDVSSDNCFLATASVDGDVRIWGLKDGCPVAILRGHAGGANMVTWSSLTPYRVISTGSDGYARIWDIREACLKRYGSVVGKRKEYRLQLTDSEKESQMESRSNSIAESRPENLLPPLPLREGAVAGAATVSIALASAPSQARVAVPPLPAAVPLLSGAGGDANVPNQNAATGVNNENNNVVPGQFVANDEIDEGVKLLVKFKHGTAGEDVAGPGTRSRRAAVNVICVARCPLGGHFTTGSDDGICRVWEDIDDVGIAIIDQRVARGIFSRADNVLSKRRTRASLSGGPILELMGHVSAITDLAYSRAGDRILSASQKDGVIRIWSLGMNFVASGRNGHVTGERGVTQIVIKLTDPCSSTEQPSHSRRGPGNTSRSETSKVSCDAAVWSHDDSRVITSQSILVKQNGSDIQPGSQYLFLWHSSSGHCLMGISGAHTSQCPVVIPHPTDSSIVCTAAADGFAKVWDWERGRCVFTHRNNVEFGPVEPDERGKLAGYLDGAFSPDGTTIVLTDDDGRVTIFDSTGGAQDPEGNCMKAWMREQYFANDYYELFYDRNGYCIERGSERPPHLAPRGVRCNHSGTPWSDEVNEAFHKLIGPMPLPERDCLWRRERIRSQRRIAFGKKTVVNEGRTTIVHRGVREYDPLSTILIKASGHVGHANRPSNTGSQQFRDRPVSSSVSPGSNAGNNENTRALSENFRWRDYDDLIREQGNPEDDIDSDDEEYDPTSRNINRVDHSDDSDEDLDLDEVDAESPFRPRGRRRDVPSGERQRRAQRRAQRRDNQFVEIGSDDELVAQFMSTNNTPSGPYVRDYTIAGHFWRLSGSIGRVKRRWLRRPESLSSFEGRKIYTPQLGDSVVYIPRAHQETLKDFPSLTPPWHRWPQGAAWPVVRCSIRGIRFRFPYEDYFRGRQTMCNSVVAILTLEVTGIPELSENRDFPWPKPSFIEPTRSHVFEVSLFENDKCEFVFPEGQYTGRLRSLERSVRARSLQFSGLEVNIYYNESNDIEDSEMRVYPATIQGLQEEDAYANANLKGSGFGVVELDCEDYSDNFSPWEIVTEGATFSQPSLTDDEKKIVLDALKTQQKKSSVNDYLTRPVDQVRYSDYPTMVEVEMNILFIKRRLESNYYSSKLSVASDLRLIRDNCIKYNTIENDLSQIACELCNEFEEEVLTSEERSQFITEEDFNNLTNDSRNQGEFRRVPNMRRQLRQRSNDVIVENQVSNETPYSLRDRTRQRQSSLERATREGARITRRRVLQNEFESSTTGQRRSTRSQQPTRNTEALGQFSRSRANPERGNRRRTRDVFEEAERIEESGNVAELNLTDDEDERKPSADGSLSSSDYEEEARSKEEESDEDQEIELATRRSRRHLNRATTVQGRNRYEDEDDDEHSALHEEPRRFRMSRRSSSRTANQGRERKRRATRAASEASSEDYESESGLSEEEDSDANDYVAEPAISQQRKRASRVRATNQVRSSSRSTRKPITVPPEESPTRRSTRKSALHNTSYEEIPSDYEPEDDESDESGEDAPMPKNRTRRVARYTELPSDFDDEADFSEDESPRHGTRPKKRKQVTKKTESPVSKRNKSNESVEFPSLREWPEINVKDITRVSKGMIKRFVEADHQSLFQAPVIEEYPELTDAYLSVVDNPMDLRTIDEERINQYTSIIDLQRDLILIFENSSKFNEKGSEIQTYAIKLWNQVNQAFLEVCRDVGVLLPRRWKP